MSQAGVLVVADEPGVVLFLEGNSGGPVGPNGSDTILVEGTGSITVGGTAVSNTLTASLTGLTNHAVLVGAGNATITKVGPTSTAGQVLQSSGSGSDPAFSTATYPSTTTANQVLYSSATNTVGGITAGNNGVFISNSSGVPSWLPDGTTGQVLTATTGSPPSWENLPAAGVTSISGTANEITASASTGAVTLSTPSTFIAPGTIAATTSVSSPEVLLTGSGSGTISVLPQASSGTYNFNLPITAGTSGYLLASAGGAGAPMTWTNPAPFQLPVSQFVVAPTGYSAYQTVQSAINAAHALSPTATTQQTVWIWPGTYTENLTLFSFVNLAAATGNSLPVVINGNSTWNETSATGTFNATNICFQTPSGGGAALTISGSTTLTSTLQDCYFNASTGTGLSMTSTSTHISIYLLSCLGFSASGHSILSMANSVTIALYVLGGYYKSTDTASIFAGTSAITYQGVFCEDSLELKQTATLNSSNCVHIFYGGSLSPINLMSSGSSLNIYSCQLDTSSTYVITGSGTLSFSGLTSYNDGTPLINPSLLNALNSILMTQNISFDGGTTLLGSNGQLIIGNATNGYPSIGTLTAGTGVSVTNGAGSITLAATGTFSGGLVTAPVSSHTATAGFGSSLTAGTAKQNTLGYDIHLNIAVLVASSTTATLTLGVGSTSTPTVDTVIPSFTVATSTFFTFSAIVPSNYYVLVNDTGTITISSITVQACPL